MMSVGKVARDEDAANVRGSVLCCSVEEIVDSFLERINLKLDVQVFLVRVESCKVVVLCSYQYDPNTGAADDPMNDSQS